MEELILPVLRRYIELYGWSWSLSGRVINRYFGTSYTVSQLKELYQAKNPRP